MKTIFKPITAILLAFILFSFCPKPEQVKLDLQVELVLHFNELSPKKITEVETLLSSITGINYIDYCERYEVFLLTYDNGVFLSEDHAIKAITNLNPDLKPISMKGNSIEAVSNNCQ